MYAADFRSAPRGLPFEFVPYQSLAGAAAAGELRIAPASARDAPRRDLARMVLQGGLDSLCRGSGPIQQIVVSADPTLDDMLAALIAERLIEGVPAPDGLAKFAQYAAEARAGHNPGSLPPDQSLAALYLFVRAGCDPLDDPEQRARFEQAWSQLAAMILRAAGQPDECDPFQQDLVPSWMFRAEQQQLAADHAMYLRDRQAGERWSVQIPDEGKPVPLRSALVLNRPRSRLWKFWARSDPQAGGGPVRRTISRLLRRETPAGYALLGVRESDRPFWVFSTDPRLMVRIGSLEKALNRAESKINASRARSDPWIAKFEHTLVGGPLAGSAMSDEEVLGVARAWSNARPVRSRATLGWATVATLAIVLTSWLLLRPSPVPAEQTKATAVALSSRPIQFAYDFNSADAEEVPIKDDGTLQRGIAIHCTIDSVNPDVMLPRGILTFRWQVNKGPEQKRAVTLDGREPSVVCALPGYFSLPQGENSGAWKASFEAADPSTLFPPVYPKCRIAANPKHRPRLFLLAAGVTEFNGDLAGFPLPYCRNDVERLEAAFTAADVDARFFQGKGRQDDGDEREGKPVARARVNPTRDGIRDDIESICSHATHGDLAVIAISTHGIVHNGEPLLVPYNLARGERLDSAAISLESLAAQLTSRENPLRCPAVIILDTCYSGTARWDDLLKTRAQRFPNAQTLVLVASVGRGEQHVGLGHSVLTYAVLRALGAATEKADDVRTPPPEQGITFAELKRKSLALANAIAPNAHAEAFPDGDSALSKLYIIPPVVPK